MIINATTIWEWQSCRRRYALSREWRPLRWRPKALLDACLRRAVMVLSSGGDPVKAASEARAQFMQAGASPGLDVAYGQNPYTLAKDYCTLLDVVIRSIARLTLLTLKDVPPVPLDGVDWKVLAQADDSGTLHRWVTCDYWGRDDLMRELHGWFVAGDVMLTECPMVLHVVEIGQVRDGKLHSPWTRGYQHPGMPAISPVRFKYKSGHMPEGWTPVYLVDKPRANVEKWVDQLWADGAAEPHLKHITVAVPSKEVCDDARQQLRHETLSMRSTRNIPWQTHPMSRGACDGMVPCPFQYVCYSDQRPELVEIDKIGLYQRREGNMVLAPKGADPAP